MKKPFIKAALGSLLTLLLSVSFSEAYAGRILINDAHQTVILNQPLNCFEAADITIDTDNPDVFASGAPQLQAIADTAHAMLSYECPGLDKIELSGLVHGLNETVYRGQLSARNAWQVQATDNTQNTLATAPTLPTGSDDTQADDALAITGLKLGMSIAAAIEAVQETFGRSPGYNAENGMLTLQTGACPNGADVIPALNSNTVDWKCLKAQFSNERIPALEYVELVQLVNSDTATVSQLLIEKFGTPQSKDTSEDGSRHIAWQSGDHTGQPAPELKAVLSNVSPTEVLTRLTLSETQGRHKPTNSYADIGLSL